MVAPKMIAIVDLRFTNNYLGCTFAFSYFFILFRQAMKKTKNQAQLAQRSLELND